MDTLPIFLRSTATRALLIGDGPEATTKCRLMVRANIKVTVLSEDPCDELSLLIDQSQLRHLAKEFEDQDLDNQDLVVIGDTPLEVAESIVAKAHHCRMQAHVVGHPDLCSFYFPKTVDRDPFKVAICSQGQSPMLGKYAQHHVERSLPRNLDKLDSLIQRYQSQVASQISNEADRDAFWSELIAGPLSETLGTAGTSPETVIEQALAAKSGQQKQTGTVYLIGAGPGDPDLLTVKAMRLLQQADVVVYDRLVSDEIMALCRDDAERIYVGKKMGNHSLPQEEINHLLVKLSQQGKRVVRLKGGDPFIFGRGGEEIEELLDEDIRFQVIPGITAASGSSTYCGIPLTHRDHAQSVTFVTGHLKAGELNLKWESLAQAHQTVVFYMGLTALPTISEQLQAHGMSADTPVALVYRATTPQQRLLVGNLDNIAEKCEEHEFKSPSLIIIGSVVSLAEKLKQT
ncbi:MAG: siroheme synthase CysG [Motiliproteus sp.]|nr:siroheme synthase CysG [Motiliproteus sp.]MCW9052228.1 siroheme synthase CysG [Motiliproteus sp.]